jgi:hypothetical protein
MRIRTRLQAVLVVLVGAVMLPGCQTIEQKELGNLQEPRESAEAEDEDDEKDNLTFLGRSEGQNDF